MALAAQPCSPVRRLVLNDVGPFIPKAALERIAAYCGKATPFADGDALEADLRDVHGSFGPLTDEQWQHLARHGGRAVEEGVALAYDPGIAVPCNAVPPVGDADLWALWDAIHCPVLVLHGETSDLLSPETAAEMAARGPKDTVIEIAGCGHAPALMDQDQVKVIDDWLGA